MMVITPERFWFAASVISMRCTSKRQKQKRFEHDLELLLSAELVVLSAGRDEKKGGMAG
jgi:hypothetical protein